MSKKCDTSKFAKYFDVDKLHGNSYSCVDLNIDGSDETINKKIKAMQAKEFKEVSESRLFTQKQHYRYTVLQGRRFRTREEVKKIEFYEKYPDMLIEEEFADIELTDFMNLNYTDEELVDLIIDIKMDDIEEEITRQERCAAWVLNHCK